MGEEAKEETMKVLGEIFAHANAHVETAVLKCAVQLGLPDIIQAQAQRSPAGITLSQIAQSLPFNPINNHNLGRLMNYMTHMGLFSKSSNARGEPTFRPTRKSQLLLRNSNPSCLLPLIRLMMEEWTMSPWHCLDAALDGQTGAATPFERKHGCTLWEALSQTPERGRMFYEAMAVDATVLMTQAVGLCKGAFEEIRSLVDVGGGTGQAAALVKAAFPSVKCSVLDRAEVAEGGVICPGIEFIPGDMFTSVPHADAFLLKLAGPSSSHILSSDRPITGAKTKPMNLHFKKRLAYKVKIMHDWDDEKCMKILKLCKEALPKEGGKVVIVEAVVGQDGELNGDEAWTKAMLAVDLGMMMFTGGRERNLEEWKQLLTTAGFNIHNITPIFGPQSLIEAHPI